ncbi:3-beta hydroxysteroid dehydrogenase [Saccharomonospora piscinae]|uniref:3-beta hydroxysteroid dehydrogenase n=1 Tax=Saccharomonospora piscinae TaxID=687388 RepID=A0A1V8ZY00_SACPI|nr:NAD(P)H-binding protein [Saccharomonospora piscinae]OQO89671.1 3-beta hydroxysteroid dehydrogenase [Saccharomonospora piscinae]
MAKICVVGANGVLGSRILDESLDRGHQVTAVVRQPSKLGTRSGSPAVLTGDVLDPASVAAFVEGQDVVVSAVGGGDGPGHVRLIEPSLRTLVDVLRKAGPEAPRLVAVGGAGSLAIGPGKKVWDFPGLPEGALQTMHAHGDGLAFLRTVTDVRWTSVSPPVIIAPGARTGRYRTGTDSLVADGTGKSHISAEDYAVALVDEIENPQYIGRRFTVAY